MSEYDKLDQLAEFKPFYDEFTTQRLVAGYQQSPHSYPPDLVAQIKDHAVHYKMEVPEAPVGHPKDADFNLLRGIRGVGEGFLSGFTTFQVGEPSANPYERIMRSVGQLGGFVGYIPTAPAKILAAARLINPGTARGMITAAQNLRGKSVPLMISKAATDKVAPIVSNTLGKAATVKNSAFKDAATFLTGDKVKHTAEGAFNLGIASAVGSWQLGVNEMLHSGLHGAVTGGMFRGIANMVNAGGIPKLDQATGRYILDATQKQDQLIRSAASSLYEGLASTARGETTPEIIYSYLLGAYFGAHETTAGQAMAMRHVQKTEKQALTSAKELRRLDKDGKPYDWDTEVYDPRVVEGWDSLPKDAQDSVIHTILTRHGTMGKQIMMASDVVEKSMLEKIDYEKLLDTDQLTKPSVRETQIQEKVDEIATRLVQVDKIDPEQVKNEKGNIFIQERSSTATYKKPSTTMTSKETVEDLESRVLNTKELTDTEMKTYIEKALSLDKESGQMRVEPWELMDGLKALERSVEKTHGGNFPNEHINRWKSTLETIAKENRRETQFIGPKVNEDAVVNVKGAEVELYKNRIKNKNFDELDAMIDWQEGGQKFQRTGDPKTKRPIDTQYYGDKGTEYTYGKGDSAETYKPMEWTPELLEIKKQVEEATGYTFNSAVVNRYKSRKDSIGHHTDAEPELQRKDGRGPVIASVSFGEGRTFELKPQKGKKGLKQKNFYLEDGDIMLMKGDTQKNYTHGISKSKKFKGPRINITFRRTSKGRHAPRTLDKAYLEGGNVLNLPIRGMTDNTLNYNKKVIKEAIEEVQKYPDRLTYIEKDIGSHLKKTAPKTYDFLMDRLTEIERPFKRAEKILSKEKKIQEEQNSLDDSDIGDTPEATIEKKSRQFVHKYLAKDWDNLTKEDKTIKIVEAHDTVGKVLKKHFRARKQGKNTTLNSDKFIEDLENALLLENRFGLSARRELRQLLMRQNQTKPILNMSLNIKAGKVQNAVLLGEVPVGKGKVALVEQNLAGNSKLQGESIKMIDIAWDQIAPEGQKTERAYMVVDHVIFKKGNYFQEVELRKLNDKKNYYGKAAFNQALADMNARRIKGNILVEASKMGYYLNGGKGDSGKMYMFKWHPDVQKTSRGGILKTAENMIESFKRNNPDALDHFDRMRSKFVSEYGDAMKDGPMTAQEYFNRAFVSNILWEKQMYGLSEANISKAAPKDFVKDNKREYNFVDWLMDHSSIQDAKGFNKRNQIWLTDGFELDQQFFMKDYQARMDRIKEKADPDSLFELGSLHRNKATFRLIDDAHGKDLGKYTKADKYTEATDGMVVVEEIFLDSLNESFGHPPSGQNKTFIAGKDSKHGALLGKFMFHKATPEASKQMREEGVHFYMFDSAVKEKGDRKHGVLNVKEDLSSEFTAKKGEGQYEVDLTALKGSLSEKQTEHMMGAQLIPKQLMANLVQHSHNPIAMEHMKDFFDATIGDKFKGVEKWNDELTRALQKDPAEFTESEQARFLDNIENVGLNEVIDALKSPLHGDFVSKLYRKVLKKNVDDITFDYQSGEMSSAEYREAVAHATNMTSGINRMMDIMPTQEIFLHKDVRNYLQAAMRSFVVNRVIRPKWDYSVSARMRGLDPWLRQKEGLKDLNLAPGETVIDPVTGSKEKAEVYLKRKYGVENADELVFLDNSFKESVWDLGPYLTGEGKMKLGEIWERYGTETARKANSDKINRKMEEFFRTISLRVPMDSISGAHRLTFAGFTGVDGHGAVFHPRTMRALGGADLDGDKAFLMFGMKKEWKDMYHKNKYEFEDAEGKIRDNKGEKIPEEGLRILEKHLNVEDPHDLIVSNKIKAGKLTYRDLLTTTNDGGSGMELKASNVGKYTINERMDMGFAAAQGRDILAPAVTNKQVLNAVYEALNNNRIQRYRHRKNRGLYMSKDRYDELKKRNDDTIKNYEIDRREKLKVTIFGDFGKTRDEYEVYIEPRTSEKELKYARELARAQIAFGSDPLDELGMASRESFFNSAWHSLFKVDFGANAKALEGVFDPSKHARQGTFKIMKDFNNAYFSRNWTEGRRYYASEIMEMAQGIHKLSDAQKQTMLPRMVDILKDMDYADDIVTRVDEFKIKKRYEDYNKNTIFELRDINNSYDIEGGLLGRGTDRSTGFRSEMHNYAKVVLREGLGKPTKRIEIHQDAELFRELFENPLLKKYFPKKNKDFWRKADPEKFAKEYQDMYDLYDDIAAAEGFRKAEVDKLYRKGTEFIQNDAMDRASGKQLIYALNVALKEGTSREFIHKMGKVVENIKQVDRIEKRKAMEMDLQESTEYQSLDQAGKNQVAKFFGAANRPKKGYEVQKDINKQIYEFKYQNKDRQKETGNRSMVLTEAQAYLFDTLMMSTYYRGKNYTKLQEWKKLPDSVKKLIAPQMRKVMFDNSGTYFNKTGLNSQFVDAKPIKDFLEQYTQEFVDVRVGPREKIEYDKVLDKEPVQTEKKEEIPDSTPMVQVEDHSGLRPIREKAVAELNKTETKMVDELAAHIQHYRDSFPEGLISLNKIARSVRRKNLDAFTIEDYRIMNNLFRGMRAGNMFIDPGKLTKEGIVKLSQRHYMLFPKTISEELMVKDFDIFEQKGMFQNYNGEWVEGKVGQPTQIVEKVQYAIGTAQDMAVKMEQDEKNILHEALKDKTGWETIEGGMGERFFEVATALRDYKAEVRKKGTRSQSEHHFEMKKAVNNLREAYKNADWENTKTKEFNISGLKVKEGGGSAVRTGEEIVKSIDGVLTERALDTFQWIRGKHWSYVDGQWIQTKDNPLEHFMVRDKKNKIEYWDEKQSVPKIDSKRFAQYILKRMKDGKPMDLKLGLDNLRVASRSIMIEHLTEQARNMEGPQAEMMTELIEGLKRQYIKPTDFYRADEYHPHYVENKTLAKESIIKAIEKINKSNTPQEQKDVEIAGLIQKYRNMTGQWIVEDIVDAQMLDGALQEIAQKKKGEHLTWFEGNPIAHGMMSRSSNLAGWARDLGSWEMYQKNLVDTYFRQIGQIVSRKMLSDFNKHTARKWNDSDQAIAWNNFMSDYISRSLGHPSRVPDHWLNGPEAKLMKVKGTPYAWWADNRVKDKLNKIRRKFGIKEDMRLPEELRGLDEMDIRHWSNLEAKYQMATLLAHPKSAVTNIFGGTLHTIQSTGWRHWLNARNVGYLRTHIGGDIASNWTSKADLNKWVIGHGVVPDFIMHEAGLNPFFKKGKWKNFMEDAKKVIEKDPMVGDSTLLDIAKKHKITEAAFQKAAWFMREPERMLRRDSFIAHYLQARELYGHSNMELDHPILIEAAKKGVKATQFLYSAPYRPAFSSSSLGKVMTRFQTWAWNSVRFRKEVYKQAKLYDFKPGTMEFDRFKRQYLTDMFVFGLGNVFAYSIFESGMPAPWNWFQDTADWIFGDENERDRAFFGQWPTAIAPLQMVTPPGLRLVPATFNALVNNDFSRISEYHMWTMFPFGRMARDVKGSLENPMRTIEKGTGIPYMAFAQEATKHRKKDEDAPETTED